MNACEPFAKKINPGETRTSVLMCYDGFMDAAESQNQIKILFDCAANQGLKIVKVVCPDAFVHNGVYLENRIRNKMKLILEKATFQDDEEKSEAFDGLVDFFRNKIRK